MAYPLTISGADRNKNHPNTDLVELRLGDTMIEMLKSGKINTRLMCEMAAHKDFVKMLADIEIYVDGIVGMLVQSLNTWINVVRKEIMDKYRPGGNDTYLRLLKAAHIELEVDGGWRRSIGNLVFIS